MHTLCASLNKTNTCFDHGLPTLHIRVINTLVPKSLEPNMALFRSHYLIKKTISLKKKKKKKTLNWTRDTNKTTIGI